VTLERRQKPSETPEQTIDTDETDQTAKHRAESDEARKDASDRAAELLARLRKL
jgi:hypothetical protein